MIPVIQIKQAFQALSGTELIELQGGNATAMSIGRINAYHRDVENLVNRRCMGVASRYLMNYFGWMRRMAQHKPFGGDLLAEMMAIQKAKEGGFVVSAGAIGGSDNPDDKYFIWSFKMEMRRIIQIVESVEIATEQVTMITTNNDSAKGVLNRIETEGGSWTAYGNDGRHTLEAVEGQDAGNGFRARFIDNPHGGDYGWGPLASNEAEAIALFLAEYVASTER